MKYFLLGIFAIPILIVLLFFNYELAFFSDDMEIVLISVYDVYVGINTYVFLAVLVLILSALCITIYSIFNERKKSRMN